MRILLTNDDGINAPGLATLEKIAAALSDDVWVIAPALEQSGVGHCINYTRPTLLTQIGPRRFAIEGSPADCVLVGLHEIMKDAKPDLILSGVNRGNNAGENTLYSGTIGACIEAALQGYNAIAMSQFFGAENAQLDDPFEAAVTHGTALVQALLDQGIWTDDAYRILYNVNFPPMPAADVKGQRIVAQGYRPTARFTVEPQTSPSGRRYTWIKGGDQRERTAKGTDVSANLDGYISVTPMRADLTAHDLLDRLKEQMA